MNKEEVGQLLTLAALIDNRTVTVEACLMWHEIAGHVDYHDAVDAMRDHYRERSDWLMPVHVIERVKAKHRRELPATMSPESPNDCGNHRWMHDGTCLFCTTRKELS